MPKNYHDEMGPYVEASPDVFIYTDDGNFLRVSQKFINEYKHLTEHPGAISSLKTYIANKFK